jgi:hypothetical protein
MFDLEKALLNWRQQVKDAGLRDEELLRELENHLRDDIGESVRNGATLQEAFASALRRMGQAHELGTEFGKIGGFKRSLRQKLRKLRALFQEAPDSLLTANLSAGALQTLEFAREEAPRLRHDFIGTEHVLLGLVRSDSGAVSKVLSALGINREALVKEIADYVGVGPEAPQVDGRAIPFTPRAKNALRIAAREAFGLKQKEVAPEHIFLGLLIEGDGVAARVLSRMGVQIDKTRRTILNNLNSPD